MAYLVQAFHRINLTCEVIGKHLRFGALDSTSSCSGSGPSERLARFVDDGVFGSGLPQIDSSSSVALDVMPALPLPLLEQAAEVEGLADGFCDRVRVDWLNGTNELPGKKEERICAFCQNNTYVGRWSG